MPPRIGKSEIKLFQFGLCKKAINIQPVHECIEPTITGSIGIAQAEPMSAILIKMKLNWDACFEPGINNTKLLPKKKIISCNNIEHRRSIFWHCYGAHTTIDRSNKSKFHDFRVQCA